MAVPATLKEVVPIAVQPEHSVAEVLSRGRGMTISRPPEYHVYLYNVGKRQLPPVERPPLWPIQTIAACTKGERFVPVASVPHPRIQTYIDSATNKLRDDLHDGLSVAMDLIFPDNPTSDLDFVIPQAYRSGIGTNLAVHGVFWSYSFPPKEEEIAAAENRRDNYYRKLLNEAREIELSNPAALKEIIGPDHHIAAEHFNEETSWHRKYVSKMDCPNCGQSIKSGVKYHMNSETGKACPIDKEWCMENGIINRPASGKKGE